MWHWRRRRLYELASKFHGPPVLPIIGNAHQLAGSSEHIFNKLINLIEKYPPPSRMWLGPRLSLFVADPERIKTLCLSPKALEKGDVTEFSRILLGEGLLGAPVAKWQVSRKLIQPTFNPRILDSFVEVFAAQSLIFTERIERHLDDAEFQIFNLVSACTLDMICETAMGVKMRTQLNGNYSYVEALQVAIGSICKRFLHFWLHPDVVFYRTKLGKDQRKHIKYIHDFTDNVIQTRRNELLDSSGQPDTAADGYDASESPPRREAFLDHLIKLNSLSDQQLRDEVTTMVLTGNDTSGVTLTHVLSMLASHPEVQEKAYQELFDIYGDSEVEERPVTFEDLPRFKYIERVIRETLRLFPVLPFTFRLLTDDVIIGDRTFPSGASVVIGIFTLHRCEKYWPDPLKFDPNRFLPEEVAKRHPYAYMAFSGGPRNCIGYKYAMMSMKTLVATVLRRYVLKKDNIVPIGDIRFRLEFIMKPVDPIKIRIEKRTRN